eukprot:CAMPEP_0115525822 /NCGR_PEP_ID=MMETSP0271-20121206/81957_1 /TAXON_ID=71861 /ORGANISM="Scrippsiella trochoidea, Strain CCMP3099" /LENGTH=70 /DNA_ID=CAMNT_0002957491 /DNA_START=16 /DNA_END=225 /DNA_ORIENTATION=-
MGPGLRGPRPRQLDSSPPPREGLALVLDKLLAVAAGFPAALRSSAAAVGTAGVASASLCSPCAGSASAVT